MAAQQATVPDFPDVENARGLQSPNEKRVMRRTCSRWGKALLLGMLLAVIGSGIGYWWWTPMYEAVACIRIESRQQHIAFEVKNEDGNAMKSYVQTQIQLLHHPVVLGKMLSVDDHPEIVKMPEIMTKPDPVKWLAEQITVKQEGDSELYDVAYAAPDPKAAAIVVNALLDEYFKLRGQEDSSRTVQVIHTLQMECDNRFSEIKKMREVVRDLAQQVNGTDQLMGKSESTVVANHPLAEQQNRLVNAEVEKAILEAKIKAYRSAAEEDTPIFDEMIKNKVELQPEVLRIKSEIADLRIQLKSLDSIPKRSGKDPTYEQISEQIKKNEQLLESLQRHLQKQFKLETTAKRNEQIAALESDLESTNIIIAELNKVFPSQKDEVKHSSGDTLQLRFKLGELDRAEKVYAMISERIMELKTESGAPERVIVIQKALTPTSPTEVFPWSLVLTCGLVGFILPFLAILVYSAISFLMAVCFPKVKYQVGYQHPTDNVLANNS